MEYLKDLYIICISFMALIIAPYLFIYKIRPADKFKNRFISDKLTPATKESIANTIRSFFILIIIYSLIYFLENNSIFKWKKEASIISHLILVAVLVVLNDMYFYWAHFLFHRFKPLVKYHRIHHKDKNPTPLSAFNFHPVEALVNFSFYIIIAILIPMQKIDLYFIYLYMLFNNLLGHLPIEFCPRWLYFYKQTSWLNAATHHIMHHQKGSSNFSLYFLFWDIKIKTLDKDYYKRFREVKEKILL